MICFHLHRHSNRLSYQNTPFSSPESISLNPHHQQHPLLSQGPISSPSAETSTYGNCNEKDTFGFHYIRKSHGFFSLNTVTEGLSWLSEFPGGALRPTLGITARRPVFPDSSTAAYVPGCRVRFSECKPIIIHESRKEETSLSAEIIKIRRFTTSYHLHKTCELSTSNILFIAPRVLSLLLISLSSPRKRRCRLPLSRSVYTGIRLFHL